MERDSYENGVPSWVDLASPDPARAATFYGQLFGWEVGPGEAEAGGYAIAQLRGRPVAGIQPQQSPGPSVWASYVNVDSADATFAKATDAGGAAILEPMDVMDAGRLAFFADPAGAVIGLWQPGAHKGAGIVNEPGTFSWNELITTDIDGSKTFYKAVFAWDAETHGEGPGAYTEFKLDGQSVAGMMAKGSDMPAEMPPNWGVYFTVDSTDDALAEISRLGGSAITPVMDIEPGRFAVVADPFGAIFNIIQLKQPVG